MIPAGFPCLTAPRASSSEARRNAHRTSLLPEAVFRSSYKTTFLLSPSENALFF
jgi:hypothetical protein